MSELTDMRAFGDIEAEIEAEKEADPARKKLGVFFWICVGWIALNIILALTANAFPQDHGDCLEAGMQGFVEKPMTVAALRRTLARYLGAPPQGSGEMPGSQSGSGDVTVGTASGRP